MLLSLSPLPHGNLPANQTTCQPTNRPTNHRNNQPINQPTDQPTNRQVTRNEAANRELDFAHNSKQYVSGNGLITACLDSLMRHVNIPTGYAVLCTDLFGYDGCLAEVVLQANVRDPCTFRSCATICPNAPDSQSYIRGMVDTLVFNMVKSNDLDILGFPDWQQAVDKQRSMDSQLTLKPQATVYLRPRVLAVLERHLRRWTFDPMHGEASRT